MKDARLLLHKLTRVNLSLFHKLCTALLARCRIAPQKNEKQARRSWKLRLFSNKRPLRILLDFKSMNPHWLLQFPYAALIMIVYYCHSCMYFRKKAENLEKAAAGKSGACEYRRKLQRGSRRAAALPRAEKQERKRGKWKEERCVGAGCCA